MAISLSYCKHVLHFKSDAKTSRGTLRTKDSWIIKIHDQSDSSFYGLGEVSIIERLSHDYHVDFDKELHNLMLALKQENVPISREDVEPILKRTIPVHLPAMRFALETALLDLLHGGTRMIFDNAFYHHGSTIRTNGLIWMGDFDKMKADITEKFDAGFKCIKLKIGAIDFDKEIALIEFMRSLGSKDVLEIRVDANGGFLTQDVLRQLEILSQFDLHSIEQPIMPRQVHAMQLICEKSKIPVALDEELIGVYGKDRKILLEDIKPAYIVLKPSLLGGLTQTKQWIELAQSMNIGWWLTSALESNIGLNAIAQFAYECDVKMHQGLGTSQLYDNNIYAPLLLQGEELSYRKNLRWDLSDLVFD